MVLVVKNPPANAEDKALDRFLGQEDPLEEGMAVLGNILAWEIPRKPSGLQSIESQRVGRD